MDKDNEKKVKNICLTEWERSELEYKTNDTLEYYREDELNKELQNLFECIRENRDITFWLEAYRSKLDDVNNYIKLINKLRLKGETKIPRKLEDPRINGYLDMYSKIPIRYDEIEDEFRSFEYEANDCDYNNKPFSKNLLEKITKFQYSLEEYNKHIDEANKLAIKKYEFFKNEARDARVYENKSGVNVCLENLIGDWLKSQCALIDD